MSELRNFNVVEMMQAYRDMRYPIALAHMACNLAFLIEIKADANENL